MIRFLSFSSPVVFVFLFIAVWLLRIPSFHPGFFATDESFYIVSAQKIVEGGVQYVDTVDNKPPVLAWFYSFFVWISGDAALLIIRIFTCFYLFASAMLLNTFVVRSRITDHFSAIPGFFLIVLCSSPWYAQEMNGELLMLLPVIQAFRILARLHEGEDAEPEYRLFIAGTLLGLSFMIKYQALFLFFGFGVAYLIILPPRFKDLLSLLAGFIITVAGILSLVYFSGGFSSFWKLGVLYNLDYMRIGINPGENISYFSGLWSVMKLWGGFVFFTVIAVLYFRSNYFKLPIRLRKTETILFVWLVSGFIAVLAGGSRLYLHYFIFIFPPIAAYSGRFFELSIHPFLRSVLFYASVTVPFLVLGQGLYCSFPNAFSFAKPVFKEDGWTSKMTLTMNRPHILSHVITDSMAKKGILVLNYQPEIYLRLKARCATPYTNFGIGYYRFGIFPGTEGYSLFSGHEKLDEIFFRFQDDMPAAIIDSWEENNLGELFPVLQAKMPLLFSEYEGFTAGKNRVYIRH